MGEIWKHQRPEDCTQSKFLISEGWPQGFGSEVHVVGNGLAIAMNMGRIYVMNPDGPISDKQLGLNNSFQVDTKFCIERGKTTLECYFEKWTSCSITEGDYFPSYNPYISTPLIPYLYSQFLETRPLQTCVATKLRTYLIPTSKARIFGILPSGSSY